MIFPLDSITGIIEAIRKCFQVAGKWKAIENELQFAFEQVDHAKQDLDTLRRLAEGLPPPFQQQVGKRLDRATKYASTADELVSLWTTRLHLEVNGDFPPHGDAECPAETLGSEAHVPLFSRLGEVRSGVSRHRGPVDATRVAAHKSYFLMAGAVSIKNAAEKMEKSNEGLFNAVMAVSILPAGAEVKDVTIKFVRKARERDQDPHSVTHVLSPQSCAPLDSAADTMLFIVTDGVFKGCIVDRRDVRHVFADGRGEEALQDTKRIATLLLEDGQDAGGATSPNDGVLRCCGYNIPDEDTHDLIFRPAPGCTVPQTLRRLLTTEDPSYVSIVDRIDFSIKLATSVHIIHSIGLVHKGIRPDSILVMQPIAKATEDLYKLGTPYLAGFNYTRSDVSFSGLSKLYDQVMNERIYHHPRHLGENRHHKYNMHDDIYSLGICLLEIGLWKSIFRWDEAQRLFLIDSSSWDIFEKEYFLADGTFDENAWFRRKDALVMMAKAKLPASIGPRYRDVVVTCLEFGNDAQGDDNADEYKGSAHFVAEVISVLRRMKALYQM